MWKERGRTRRKPVAIQQDEQKRTEKRYVSITKHIISFFKRGSVARVRRCWPPAHRPHGCCCQRIMGKCMMWAFWGFDEREEEERGENDAVLALEALTHNKKREGETGVLRRVGGGGGFEPLFPVSGSKRRGPCPEENDISERHSNTAKQRKKTNRWDVSHGFAFLAFEQRKPPHRQSVLDPPHSRTYLFYTRHHAPPSCCCWALVIRQRPAPPRSSRC